MAALMLISCHNLPGLPTETATNILKTASKQYIYTSIGFLWPSSNSYLVLVGYILHYLHGCIFLIEPCMVLLED